MSPPATRQRLSDLLSFGFLQAYHAYVRRLSLSERNRYYAEGVTAARLYGATSAPNSEADLEMLFHATAGRLERSDVVFEFLAIMRSGAILPLLLRPASISWHEPPLI